MLGFEVIQSAVFFLKLPELTKTHGVSVRQRGWLLRGKLGCCKQEGERLLGCRNVSLGVGRPGCCSVCGTCSHRTSLASVSTRTEALN